MTDLPLCRRLKPENSFFHDDNIHRAGFTAQKRPDFTLQPCSTKRFAPRQLALSPAVKARIMSPANGLSRCEILAAAATKVATALFISDAPRPRIRPSTMSPAKGGNVHGCPPSGTVSRCAENTNGSFPRVQVHAPKYLPDLAKIHPTQMKYLIFPNGCGRLWQPSIRPREGRNLEWKSVFAKIRQRRMI